MIRLWQGWVSLTNAFFSNVKTVYHEGIYSLRESPDQSTELWKYLYLKLIDKRFQCCVMCSLTLTY